MGELPYTCEIIQVLLSHHKHGGPPIPKDAVMSFAAVPTDGIGDAKDTFDHMRKSPDFPFIESHGPEHVKINNSHFFELVEFLYHECEDFDEDDIRFRVDHYEGWDDHEWT